MTEGKNSKGRKKQGNEIIAGICFGVFVGMIGAAYAAVPIYRKFCQVTGYGGTTRRVTEGSSTVLDRKLEIVFDANTRNGLPWQFHPVQRSVTFKIGATREIHYTAHNNSNVTTRGRATFNVTPEWVGAYFNKIQCFCFTDLTLKPGETQDLPVVFFVDPAIVGQEEAKGLQSITLSYSMYPIDVTKTSSTTAETVPVTERKAPQATVNSAKTIGG